MINSIFFSGRIHLKRKKKKPSPIETLFYPISLTLSSCFLSLSSPSVAPPRLRRRPIDGCIAVVMALSAISLVSHSLALSLVHAHSEHLISLSWSPIDTVNSSVAYHRRRQPPLPTTTIVAFAHHRHILISFLRSWKQPCRHHISFDEAPISISSNTASAPPSRHLWCRFFFTTLYTYTHALTSPSLLNVVIVFAAVVFSIPATKGSALPFGHWFIILFYFFFIILFFSDRTLIDSVHTSPS